MSLPIEEVIESLKRIAKLDPKVLIAIETDLEAKEAEAKSEKAAIDPKAKNQFVIVLLDPTERLTPEFFKASGIDGFTGFVTQIPESEDAGTVLDRLHKASYSFNQSKKRGPNVINLGEIGKVKRKFLKNESVNLKTKEPVRVLISAGAIPTS